MSSAQARIEQKIVITGVDSASDAIKKAQGSLGSLGKQAVTTQKQLDQVDPAKNIREKSGDVESALKGISDFGGTAGASISKLGDGFGAVEAVTRLIPGHLGLAVTAIGGLALGAKLLFDKINQDSAKLNLLTDPQTRTLGESLGFGADQTVRLQAAFNGLTTATRPSNLAIRQVVENAKAIGADPAEAVAKFIAAWERGPEAVKALRAEIGNVADGLTPLADLARNIGLDPVALGLEASKSAAAEFNKELANLQVIEKQLEDSKKAKAEAERQRREADSKEETRHYAAVRDAERANIGLIQERLDQQAGFVREAAAELAVSKDLQTLLAKTAADQSESDLLAQLAGTKKIANGIRLEGLEEKRATLLAEQKRLMDLQSTAGSEAITNALALLGLEIKRTAVQEKAIKDAEAAEKRAKQQAGQAKAKAQRDKQAAEEKKVAEGRLRLAEEASKKEADAFDQMVDREASAYEARNASALSASEAVQATRLAELDGLAQIRTALGQHDLAAQAAAQADVIRRDAEIAKINESIEARRKEALARSAERITKDLDGDPAAMGKEEARARDELAYLEKERLANLDRVKNNYAQKEAERDLTEKEREKKKIADAGAAVNAIASKAAQSLGLFGKTGSKVGSALGAIGQGVEGVTANWGDLKASAPAAIDAVGGVASAFVDSEESKAWILAAMSAAHSVSAVASGNIPAGIGHGISAGMYAAIAGGAAGGSSGGSGGSGSAPALGGTTATGSGQSGQATQGPVQTTYNFNGIFATKAQVGKALAESNRAMSRTGYAKVRGA